VKRHLRRIPRDPMTGQAKWNLIAAPGGGFMGITSLSEAEPLKKATFGPGEDAFEGKKRYADWQFVYVPPTAVAPRPQR
jgi:hypothetical protein